MVRSNQTAVVKSHFPIVALGLITLLIISPTSFAKKSAVQHLPADANQLVRAVIANELNINESDHTHWMYRLERREAEKLTVKEVIETHEGEIDFTISVNGKPLTAEDRQKEDDRLRKLISDPEAQRKKAKDAQQDADKATEMFKMLPDAFLYHYDGQRGSLVKLAFTPNPNFHPSSREAQVFHGMEGTMWVNAKEERLVEIEGKLAQDVQFFGGLIGHLDKGGRFSVKRAELAPGHWQTTLLDVQMNGKVIIFKTIRLHQTDSMTHFRRVPGDLTPLQAAQMLKKDGFTGTGNDLSAGDAHGGAGK